MLGLQAVIESWGVTALDETAWTFYMLQACILGNFL